MNALMKCRSCSSLFATSFLKLKGRCLVDIKANAFFFFCEYGTVCRQLESLSLMNFVLPLKGECEVEIMTRLWINMNQKMRPESLMIKWVKKLEAKRIYVKAVSMNILSSRCCLNLTLSSIPLFKFNLCDGVDPLKNKLSMDYNSEGFYTSLSLYWTWFFFDLAVTFDFKVFSKLEVSSWEVVKLNLSNDNNNCNNNCY